MSNKGLGLPQTKGEFKIRGIVTGTARDNFLNNKVTKTNKLMKILNVGITTSNDNTIYATLQGMEKDKVYFSKKSEVKGQKGETKEIPWGKRFDKQPEGFRLIGIGVGLMKDDEGKNITETLTEYDAAQKIADNLTDDQSVFVRGEIEFSSFKNDKEEIRRNTKFSIKQIYGAKDIDFEAEDFEKVNDFKQHMIFMGIEKVDERFAVSAKIVNYNSIEDTEFIIDDPKLAATFKKGLKSYNAITVWGKIVNKVETEEVEEEDVWGEQDKFKNASKSYIRELVITGADPATIDKETYSESIIQEAIRADDEFGGDSWGSNNNNGDDDLPW